MISESRDGDGDEDEDGAGGRASSWLGASGDGGLTATGSVPWGWESSVAILEESEKIVLSQRLSVISATWSFVISELLEILKREDEWCDGSLLSISSQVQTDRDPRNPDRFKIYLIQQI